MNGFMANWLPILVAAVSATFVAFMGAMATTLGPWYKNLRKPSWQPPEWLFGPAWTTIFILTAIAGVIGWHRAPGVASLTLLLCLFAINGGLNILWSVLFFRWRRPDWALIEVVGLWASIAALMLALWPYAPHAALLLIPYFAWVSFASFLNLTIVKLNRPFGQALRVARS
jgi:benzodiazapine receptor